jgi:peptidoglycan-associated lipoprotein
MLFLIAKGHVMTSSRFMLIALAALAACASPSEETAFDPAACTERDFNVYFEQFEADLSPEAREAIAAVEHSLQGCRIEHVRIIGLAGPVGTEAANMEISTRRAQVIAAYLERSTQWPRSVFELRAAGEENATTDDGLNRPMRRRGRVTVTAVAP